jgi:hypothetical protein
MVSGRWPNGTSGSVRRAVDIGDWWKTEMESVFTLKYLECSTSATYYQNVTHPSREDNDAKKHNVPTSIFAYKLDSSSSRRRRRGRKLQFNSLASYAAAVAFDSRR